MPGIEALQFKKSGQDRPHREGNLKGMSNVVIKKKNNLGI